ncbi:MAG: adenylate/guanylate cyclase domain-containing protein [Planctomycetes bacterium]|nr:adenylate/guanylate cyclase domain-containing protein [Planctomycetota bacterium]
MALKRLEFTHTFKSPAAKVWPIVSDTDLLDAAAKMPPIAYRDEPQPDGTSRRFGTYKKNGVTFSYEEFPFNWIHEQEYDVYREFSSGVFKNFRHRCEIKPVDAHDESKGCTVKTLFEFETKGVLGTLFGESGTRNSGVEPYKKVFALADERLQKEQAVRTASVVGVRSGVISPGDPATAEEKTRVEAAIPRVTAEYDSPLVLNLTRAVIEKPGMDLRRMQPFKFAREWRADRKETLNVFLAATRAGLLRMRWDIICPHCRGDKQNLTGLSEVKERAFCPACNIDFDIDLDRSLEAVFSPHAQVREVEDVKYCLGGPGTTPHIVYQRLLKPGEEHRFAITLPEGRYRVRFTGDKKYRWAEARSATGKVGAAPSEQTFVIRDGGVEGPEMNLTPAVACPLVFRNESKRKVLVCIESVDWAQDALSAGELVADQRFRDLFSAEILAPGIKLAVESATILFTDLVGSTAMYGKLGDAKAFSLVWTHFDILHDIVSKHRGAIVKTIGDAIMAVFTRPLDALEAADDLHARVAAFCREKGHEHPVTLKVGMHEGPCIAVTLNERLDYFGTTVNLAARVESLSEGGDILTTASTAEHAAAEDVLKPRGWNAERISASAKGFTQPIPVLRFKRG